MPSQEYNARECRCVCNNFEDQAKCNDIWDSDSCSCKCKDILECTSGFIFDYKTCRWVVIKFVFKKTIRIYT